MKQLQSAASIQTNLSIVTERSPHAWRPASTREHGLFASLDDCELFGPSFNAAASKSKSFSSRGTSLVKDFNISVESTRHVIVVGASGHLFPELTEKRLSLKDQS